MEKNRLAFFLILLHVFLGIANLLTANVFLDKPLSAQIISYVSLLVYVLLGYYLLILKNWARIVLIILFFLSLPSSILILFKFNICFLNNLIQFVVSIWLIAVLLGKELRTLYKAKRQKNKRTVDKYAKGDLFSNMKSIMNPDDIYVTDMECVDDVNEYKRVIPNILQLADVTNVEVGAFEGEQRMITLRMDDINHTFFVTAGSDYIDSSLVKGLNEFLQKINRTGKFYAIWNCSLGQEGGFLYTEDTVRMDELMEMKDSCQSYDEISDGVKGNETGENLKEDEQNMAPFDKISLKEVLILLAGVTLLQFGSIDLILKIGLVSMGLISGILSGLLWVTGFYLIKRTLRRTTIVNL